VLGFIAGYTGSGTLVLISTGVGALVWLAIIVPMIAVTVRRLHDTDRSGWWYLLMLVPIVGLVVLVFMLLPSTPRATTASVRPFRTCNRHALAGVDLGRHGVATGG
jgi:uncharacterized membrane protein YhaH (DUF805 family)